MLDDADFISAARDGGGDLSRETGEAIDERRHLPQQAQGVADGAGGEATAMGGKIDWADAVEQARGDGGSRIGRGRLAENDEVDRMRAGEAVQQGSGAERATAGYGVGRFGREHQGARFGISGQSA